MVGRAVIAFMFMTMNDYAQGAMRHLAEEISKMPEVLECYRLSADKDYLLKVVVDVIAGYDDFMFYELARLKKVGNFSSMFVFFTVKHQTKIELEETATFSVSETSLSDSGTSPMT